MVAQNRKKPKKLRRHNSLSFGIALGSVVAALALAALAFRPRAIESAPLKPEIKVVRDFDTVMIPTPSRAVARGEKLSNVPFTLLKWPKNRVSEEYVIDVSKYGDAVALTTLPKFLPVPVNSISTDPQESNAVVDGIPDGMRAITVRVDAESAVEGWAQSGNYVDVILIRAAQDARLGLETRIIAENVKILSAGRSTEPQNTERTAPHAPQTVTLLTSQEDALRIKTAASIGRLTFALRGAKDDAPAVAITMDQQKLLGSSPPVKAEKIAFRGFARDATGNTYVLANDYRWVKAEQSSQPLPAGESAQSTNSSSLPSFADSSGTASAPSAQQGG